MHGLLGSPSPTALSSALVFLAFLLFHETLGPLPLIGPLPFEVFSRAGRSVHAASIAAVRLVSASSGGHQ